MDVVETIITILRNDATLTALLNPQEPIGYLSVGQGVPTPFVIVGDINDIPMYDGNEEVSYRYRDCYVEAVADLVGPDASGYSTTKAILDRIRDLLQNREGDLTTDDGNAICLRQGKALPSSVKTESGNEQFLRRGYRWDIVVS